MAKKIKAIKCPQCGSTSYLITRKAGLDDVYKCNNCNADYFFDSDDVNINIKHKHENSGHIFPYLKPFLIGLGVVSALVIILNVLNNFVIRNTRNDYTYTPPSIEKEPEIEKITYSLYYAYTDLFENENKNLIEFSIFNKYTDPFSEQKDYHYIFRDILSSKIYKELRFYSKKIENIRTTVIELENGNYYLILNNKLYLLNKHALTFEDVTDQLIGRHQEFSEGIAKIEETRDKNGLRIITNLGNNYIYYPIINKIYHTDDEYWRDLKYPKNVSSGTKIFDYNFYKKSLHSSEKYKKLYKTLYFSNVGGPEDYLDLEWHKEFPNKRIISYTELTPGRIYFSPYVIYHDTSEVIIKYNPTIAEDSNTLLQSLKTENGEINWTLELDKEKNRIEKVRKTSKGYMIYIEWSDQILILNNNGKVTNEITLPKKIIEDKK